MMLLTHCHDFSTCESVNPLKNFLVLILSFLTGYCCFSLGSINILIGCFQLVMVVMVIMNIIRVPCPTGF